MWKSTSSGVKPVTVNFVMKGKVERVKLKNKMSIGSFHGQSLFKRKVLSTKISKANSNLIGYRDVPYKATRTIFVLPLPTIHAQVAVGSHLVAWVSGNCISSHRLDIPFDAGHVSTGSSSTTGVRICDNAATIGSSGDPSYLVLDLDLSAFDQHSKMTNFRGPFMKVMYDVGVELGLDGYGPDGMSFEELVTYGFGEGFVNGTMVGRPYYTSVMMTL